MAEWRLELATFQSQVHCPTTKPHEKTQKTTSDIKPNTARMVMKFLPQLHQYIYYNVLKRRLKIPKMYKTAFCVPCKSNSSILRYM